MNTIVKDLKANLDAAKADPKKDIALSGLVKMADPKQGKVLTEEEIKASSSRDTSVGIKLSTTMKIRAGTNPVPKNNGGNPDDISDGSLVSKGERFQLTLKGIKGDKLPEVKAEAAKVEAPADIIVVTGAATNKPEVVTKGVK